MRTIGLLVKTENVKKTSKNVWATIVTIVQILSVACIVFAGLRYMFASADQKADIKKSMGVLAIGAVLVFGATLVLQLIANATNSVL
jgi:type IV secretory pathway VirB2 component (pilin)